MRHLSLVMPFYRNQGMLALQYATWAAYPPELKDRIEVVLVDDGSPEPAGDVPRPEGLPALRIYRVLEDRPWHQHAARNLGAKVAAGPWLLLTDMDHVLPATSLAKLLPLANRGKVYMFSRIDAPDGTPTLGRDGRMKPHPNSFAISQALYWRIGGYDEDYCGIYGTDGLFRARLLAQAKTILLRDVPLIRYSRDVVPDASTRTLLRKEGRPAFAKQDVLVRKEAEGRANVIATLQFPWERVI